MLKKHAKFSTMVTYINVFGKKIPSFSIKMITPHLSIIW